MKEEVGSTGRGGGRIGGMAAGSQAGRPRRSAGWLAARSYAPPPTPPLAAKVPSFDTSLRWIWGENEEEGGSGSAGGGGSMQDVPPGSCEVGHRPRISASTAIATPTRAGREEGADG